ncbi:MAG: glycosyltransferase family 2 protein [Vicinamibacterales bacterium]
MPKLSVTIITRDEAEQIAGALASVAWADEIVVVDSGSADGTVEIARTVTGRVFVRDWPGYVDQKNFAAKQATGDWILSLDADERVSPELAREIQAMLQAPTHAAYRMRRATWHLGRWIRGTDWYPDYQTRLYHRQAARWSGRYVHETLDVDGSVGTLDGELQHYAYRDISEHLETIDHYTTLAARQMYEGGRRATTAQLLLHPPLAFLRNYLARGGFRLGVAGLVVSVMNAVYVFLKFAKLWQLQIAAPAQNGKQPPAARPV